MRDVLKNLFSKEIILEEGSHYFYVIQPYEMKNILGAVLDEYLFTKKGSEEMYKLYKTNEGNWYNANDENAVVESSLLLALKTAIIKE